MLIRLSYILLLCALAAAALLYAYFKREGTDAPAAYTGVQRCRVCHESESSGAQFRIWSNGPHARAFTALASDSAQAYLRRASLDQTTCLACHTTLGRPPFNPAEMQLNAEGVGCERCHGGGGGYASYNVMKDRDEFLDHGGIQGTLRDCYSCHVADPAKDSHHCPFQTSPFRADSAWALIRHNVPNVPAQQPEKVLQLHKP